MSRRPAPGDKLGERDSRLDLLRIGGAFAVVWIHVSADAVVRVDLGSLNWWLVNFSQAASRWGGGAIFLMIGGALLLQRDSTRAPLAFVLDRWNRLLPAVVFWTAFYLVWRAWRTGLPSWPEMATEVVRGVPFYHLWFLYMLVGMMLIVPVLRCVVAADARISWYLLAVCGTVTAIEAAVRVGLGVSHASFLGLFPLFIVYLLGGYLCFERSWRIHPALLLVIAGLLAALVALGVGGLYPLLGERVFALMYSDRGPLVMLMTFCVFIAGLQGLPRHAERWRWYRQGGAQVAQAGLGIYVVHPFWIGTLADWGLSVHRWPSVWAVPLLVFVVFTLSALTTLAIARLPGGRRVVL